MVFGLSTLKDCVERERSLQRREKSPDIIEKPSDCGVTEARREGFKEGVAKSVNTVER